MRPRRSSSAPMITRGAPAFTSTPMKSTKATATQNSGSDRKCMAESSSASALEHGVHGRRDGGLGGPDAREPVDDLARGFDRDAAHIGHRGPLGSLDGPLRLGQ